MAVQKIALGKPAAYGQEIVKRRFRLTAATVALHNKTILDFGCGNGAQTGEFVRADCKILAVDVTLSDLQILRQHLAPRQGGCVIPIKYNGSQLPIATGAVDLVVSFDVLEHVDTEATALREIHRVLKPEGEIILTVPNKGWIFETHGAHLPVLPWHRVPFFSWLPHALHRRFARARIYRRRDIVKLLRRHAFEILHTQYMTAPLDMVKNARLKRYLQALVFRGDTTRFSILATAIFIHGRKVSAPRATL
jgi:2-polyprenyl-3-methyl-5-hydroxy-6-metoxy-1,4-benzoquinol methylase